MALSPSWTRNRPGMRALDSVRSVGAAVTIVIACACADENKTSDVAGPSERSSDLQSMVTGEAAEALHGQQFQISAAPQGSRPEITPQEARALAESFTRKHAPRIRTYLEKGHGGPINFDAVVQCRRTFYAASSYEPLDPGLPRPYHSAFGPWWMVAMCDQSDEVVLSVAVSAYATDLAIQDGRIVHRLPISGDEFRIVGVPPGWDGPIPASPERAVQIAAGRMNAKVSEIPQLIAPALSDAFPQASAWRIKLDRKGNLEGRESKRMVSIDEIYIGIPGAYTGRPEIDDTLSLGIPNPHPEVERLFVVPDPTGTGHTLRRARERSGLPSRFEPANH